MIKKIIFLLSYFAFYRIVFNTFILKYSYDFIWIRILRNGSGCGCGCDHGHGFSYSYDSSSGLCLHCPFYMMNMIMLTFAVFARSFISRNECGNIVVQRKYFGYKRLLSFSRAWECGCGWPMYGHLESSSRRWEFSVLNTDIKTICGLGLVKVSSSTRAQILVVHSPAIRHVLETMKQSK